MSILLLFQMALVCKTSPLSTFIVICHIAGIVTRETDLQIKVVTKSESLFHFIVIDWTKKKLFMHVDWLSLINAVIIYSATKFVS